jgi:hypothetical protein
VQCFIKILAPYINPGDRPTPEGKPDFNPNRGNSPGSTGGMPGLLTPIPPFVTPSFDLPTHTGHAPDSPGRFNQPLPPLSRMPDGLIPPYFESNPEDNPRIYNPEPAIPGAKHGPGGWGSEMDLDAETAGKLLQEGIKSPNGKQIYNYHSGKLYEFQPDVPGSYHGYQVPGGEVPAKVLRQMKNEGTITNAQYNRYVKESNITK